MRESARAHARTCAGAHFRTHTKTAAPTPLHAHPFARPSARQLGPHAPTHPRTHAPTHPREHAPTHPRTHKSTYERTRTHADGRSVLVQLLPSSRSTPALFACRHCAVAG
eukprot:6176147-Pleurochrysis_carterae.AAC.1